jgi:hypothetical protein
MMGLARATSKRCSNRSSVIRFVVACCPLTDLVQDKRSAFGSAYRVPPL